MRDCRNCIHYKPNGATIERTKRYFSYGNLKTISINVGRCLYFDKPIPNTNIANSCRAYMPKTEQQTME